MKLETAIKILKEWVHVDRAFIGDISSDFYKFCEEKNIAIETVLSEIEKHSLKHKN